MKTKNIIPVISYGSFASPLVNCLIGTENNENIVLYLKILRKKWRTKDIELYKEVEIAIKGCKNSGIRYLLFDLQLDITKSLKMLDINKKLYFKLKKEFGKVPPDYRSIVGKGIMSNKEYVNKASYKEFRTWSEMYIEEDIDKAVTYHTEALKLFNRNPEKNKFEILEHFEASFEKALEHPHPTFILASLNNASWYLRKILPDQAKKITSKLGFYCGYYLENGSSIIDYLDTITSFYRMNGNNDFYTYSELFIYHYEMYRDQNEIFKKKFKRNIDYFRKYSDVSTFMTLKTSEIKFSKGLRTFFNERIFNANRFARENEISKSAVYSALHGKTKYIRIKTLEKMIKGLKLMQDFENPKIINYIIQNTNERNQFEKNWSRLKYLSFYQLKRYFLRCFMVLTPFHKIEIAKLLRKCNGDKKKLYEFLRSDNNLIFLVNLENTNNQFYQARMKLVSVLFNHVESENFSDEKEPIVLRKYMNHLFKLYSFVKSFDEAESLNIFFRNYTRYNETQWKININELLSERFADPEYFIIQKFCNNLNLNPLIAYLSFWYFDDDKEKILSLISRK